MNSNVRKLVITSFAVVLNVVLGGIVSFLSIPMLYLDSVGTIYISANYGMRYGILAGVCTNLIMGVTSSPTAIPFALVNVAVAIIVSIMSKKGFTPFKAVITGLILSVICPLIGTPIRLLLFAGFTGSGTDILILSLRSAGKTIFAATFLSVIASNFIDKILSCLLVSVSSKYLPASITGMENRVVDHHSR